MPGTCRVMHLKAFHWARIGRQGTHGAVAARIGQRMRFAPSCTPTPPRPLLACPAPHTPSRQQVTARRWRRACRRHRQAAPPVRWPQAPLRPRRCAAALQRCCAA